MFSIGRASNTFVRDKHEIKEQAEKVLDQLGIPMSSAAGLFLRQVVLQWGIPLEITLPQSESLSVGTLSEGHLYEKEMWNNYPGRIREPREGAHVQCRSTDVLVPAVASVLAVA